MCLCVGVYGYLVVCGQCDRERERYFTTSHADDARRKFEKIFSPIPPPHDTKTQTLCTLSKYATIYSSIQVHINCIVYIAQTQTYTCRRMCNVRARQHSLIYIRASVVGWAGGGCVLAAMLARMCGSVEWKSTALHGWVAECTFENYTSSI